MKEYLITDTRHEIIRYFYVVEATSEEEAMRQFEAGNYYQDESEVVDCTSSTISIGSN